MELIWWSILLIGLNCNAMDSLLDLWAPLSIYIFNTNQLLAFSITAANDKPLKCYEYTEV